MLKLKGVNSFYGSSHILFDVELEVPEGKSVAVLGRNGVGKSTLLKSIVGQLNAKNKSSVNGNISYLGKELVGMKPYKIARSGIAYVPQGRHIFPSLSLKENLLLSERSAKGQKPYWTIERIYELFPSLEARQQTKGTLLSGGEQQMLTIARGLMQNPKVILLDEITEGLAPVVVNELVVITKELLKTGVTILFAEQNIKFALAASEYIYIMEKGQIVYSCETKDLGKDIIEKYLGT